MADTVATTSDYATVYLGMALANAADTRTSANPDITTETLLGQLVADGVMTDRKFALALSSDNGDGSDPASTLSFMDIGSTTTASNKAGASAKTIQFDNNYFQWRAALNGIWFGGEKNNKYGLEGNKITIETGRQCLYVPDEHYDFILRQILYSSTGYFTASGDVIVDCGDVQNMDNISLLIKNQWIVISPNEYLDEVLVDYDGDGTAERSNGMCKLCV